MSTTLPIHSLYSTWVFCYKLYKCNIEKNILLHILVKATVLFFPWTPVNFLESTYLLYRNCAQSAHCRTFPTKTRACSVHMLHTWAVDANMAWANQRRDSKHFTQSQATLEPGEKAWRDKQMQRGRQSCTTITRREHERKVLQSNEKHPQAFKILAQIILDIMC